MINDHERFKDFLYSFLLLLEEMAVSENFKNKEAKFLAELRSAERSFNFIIDQFPATQVRDIFGIEAWNEIKIRRDKVANLVATTIEQDPSIKSRYLAYCDFLKDTRRLSSFL